MALVASFTLAPWPCQNRPHKNSIQHCVPPTFCVSKRIFGVGGAESIARYRFVRKFQDHPGRGGRGAEEEDAYHRFWKCPRWDEINEQWPGEC